MRAAGATATSSRAAANALGPDRHEVGLREVPVVVRLLLRAVRREPVGPGVVVVRLLDDLLPGLVQRDLLAHGGVDPTPEEREGVHVLQLPARAVALLPRLPHGHVGIAAHRPLLHLRVGDAELDDRLPQELEEALHVVGGMEIGPRDDLDERHAAAVVVDERAAGADDPPSGAADVDRLRGVLLEVDAHDPDLEVAVLARHGERRRPRRAARRTGRSGSPSRGRDRSSSCGGRPRARRSSQPSARPRSIDHSTAVRFGTGSDPGWPRQIGHVVVFGAAPNPLGQRQNIFVRVFSWTWISRPMTVSQRHRRRSGTTSKARACSSAWPARKSVFSANCGPTS